MAAIAAPIIVNVVYAQMLKGLWRETLYWMSAANGRNEAFNNPIGQMLAKDLGKKSLDRYCAAIDDLLPKAIDSPKEAA